MTSVGIPSLIEKAAEAKSVTTSSDNINEHTDVYNDDYFKDGANS